MTQKSVEEISEILHAIYQKEARRQGDIRHPDEYAKLSENTKEYDRVLARYIITLLAAERLRVAQGLSEEDRSILEQMALDYKKIAEEKEAKLAKAWAENDRCLAESWEAHCTCAYELQEKFKRLEAELKDYQAIGNLHELSELASKVNKLRAALEQVVKCPIHNLMSCCCQKYAQQALAEKEE